MVADSSDAKEFTIVPITAHHYLRKNHYLKRLLGLLSLAMDNGLWSTMMLIIPERSQVLMRGRSSMKCV